MMIIKMGKDTLKGKNAEEIIMQMKLEDWTNYNNPQEYKDNIGRRVEIFNGMKIMYSNDEEFLEELKRVGVIDTIMRVA